MSKTQVSLKEGLAKLLGAGWSPGSPAAEAVRSSKPKKSLRVGKELASQVRKPEAEAHAVSGDGAPRATGEVFSPPTGQKSPPLTQAPDTQGQAFASLAVAAATVVKHARDVRSSAIADPGFRKQVEDTEQAAIRLHDLSKAAFKGKMSEVAKLARDNSTWLINAYRTLREASSNGELSEADVKFVRAGAREKLTALQEALATEVKSATYDRLPKGSGGNAKNLEALGPRHFGKYTRFRSRIPNMAGSRVKVIKLPVVVIFGSWVAPDRLAALGIDVEDDGGYTVLNDQVVYAVNSRELAKDPTWNGDEEDYLTRLLSRTRARTGVEYVLAGGEDKLGVSIDNKKDVTYYWVMPKKILGALPSFVKQWDFPFKRA